MSPHRKVVSPPPVVVLATPVVPDTSAAPVVGAVVEPPIIGDPPSVASVIVGSEDPHAWRSSGVAASAARVRAWARVMPRSCPVDPSPVTRMAPPCSPNERNLRRRPADATPSSYTFSSARHTWLPRGNRNTSQSAPSTVRFKSLARCSDPSRSTLAALVGVPPPLDGSCAPREWPALKDRWWIRVGRQSGSDPDRHQSGAARAGSAAGRWRGVAATSAPMRAPPCRGLASVLDRRQDSPLKRLDRQATPGRVNALAAEVYSRLCRAEVEPPPMFPDSDRCRSARRCRRGRLAGWQDC